MRSAHACRRRDPSAFSWGRFWQGRHLVQLTGGAANFDLAATSVKHLFELLAERHPALAPHLAEGVPVAIDGQIYQDTLHEPIAPDSEVFALPQIAGGDSH